MNKSQNIRYLEQYIINIYIIPIITLIGVLTNILNVIIFIKIILNQKSKTQGFMYKYLLLKSIVDLCHSMLHIPAPIFYIKYASKAHSYLAQLWFTYFYNYGEFVAELFSIFLDIFATIDCYVYINKNEFIKKFKNYITNFKLNTILAFIYSVVFYLYLIFEYRIIFCDGNYIAEKTEFHYSTSMKVFKLIHTFLRDVVLLIILVISNILIFLSIKSSVHLKKKSTISKYKTKSSKVEQTIRRSRIMIISIGIVYLIGHIPVNVYYMVLFFKGSTIWWNFYYMYCMILFYLYYSITFFIYLIFNKEFKRIFVKIFYNKQQNS